MIRRLLHALGLGATAPRAGSAPQSPEPPQPTEPPQSPEPPQPTPAEVAFVEQCWADFAAVGLRWSGGVPRLSAAEWARATLAGIGAHGGAAPAENRIAALPNPVLTVLWQEDEESGEPLFDNARIIVDHVFDGAAEADLADTIAAVLHLADPEFAAAAVSVTGPIGRDERYLVRVSGPLSAEFGLRQNKDFDWSLIARLNEHLPDSATGRFGWIGDGGSVLVAYLPPAQLAALGTLAGLPFDQG
ncbi:hypothetical protein [Granulicoccus phenolivorans]|uniref:hypothetical protein n=1 Tax=Granulicoccus phenolivorans TaxID=266854 RepID=UPI000410F22A|nr:hypothetical protein [Granulicoccus phenolivorans]